jgi:hypothetical protein
MSGIVRKEEAIPDILPFAGQRRSATFCESILILEFHRRDAETPIAGQKNKTARPESRAGGVNYCDPQQIHLSAAVKPN